MKPVIWTDALDMNLRKARLEDGLSWDEIEARMGVNHQLCKRRAKDLGIPTGRIATTKMMAARRAIRRL